MKKTICMLIAAFLLQTVPAIALDIDGWEITLYPDKVENKTDFVLEEEFETYTGDLALNKIEKTAPNGQTWVLIPVTVTRPEATGEKLDSMAFSLTIDGQTYQREKDDSFLVDFHIRPLTKLKINRGTHNGVVLFTVPNTLNFKKATLTYKGYTVGNL